MLSTNDHRRNYDQFRYVYPVISRRAGGISLGINLNPNNACNWACIYCQVPNLKRGSPPPLDLSLLTQELKSLLQHILHGNFMQQEIPEDTPPRLLDIAFSGNGEPTSAKEFASAITTVIQIMQTMQLLPAVKLRLITNGSLMHRIEVQEGIRHLGEIAGEVWFKIDRVTSSGTKTTNGIRLNPAKTRHNLHCCAQLATTWIQTCWFALDGLAPSIEEENAYLHFIEETRAEIQGIHLYGLARPSLQPEAKRLSAIPASQLESFAEKIRSLDITVTVNP